MFPEWLSTPDLSRTCHLSGGVGMPWFICCWARIAVLLAEKRFSFSLRSHLHRLQCWTQRMTSYMHVWLVISTVRRAVRCCQVVRMLQLWIVWKRDCGWSLRLCDLACWWIPQNPRPYAPEISKYVCAKWGAPCLICKGSFQTGSFFRKDLLIDSRWCYTKCGWAPQK